MAQQLFLTLPVNDVGRAKRFFSELDFAFEDSFSSESGVAMKVGDAFVMLLAADHFADVVPGMPADHASDEALVAFSVDSRDDADRVAALAEKAGATLQDTRDFGWMYERPFTDLDGHQWEAMYVEAPPTS